MTANFFFLNHECPKLWSHDISWHFCHLSTDLLVIRWAGRRPWPLGFGSESIQCQACSTWHSARGVIPKSSVYIMQPRMRRVFWGFLTIAGESFEKTCDLMLCLQCLTIFEQSEINKCVFLEAGGERALHFTWGLRGRETGANFGTDKKTWCRMPWQGASRKGLSPLRDQDPDPINWVSALVTGYWPLLIRWISMTSGESDKAELRWFRTGWAFWGFIPPLWMQIIATGTLRISNCPR